ncbi:hypothetical protein FO519_001588 [Halicephalobus sp. NKZ332]|nr:hypothetical protein FO519_001588 [Halicephalobus sp. NKZ332]
MITTRTLGELSTFAVFLGAIHVAYYKIQMNESLVPANERQELFYVRWLKNQFPSLKAYGIPQKPNSQ